MRTGALAVIDPALAGIFLTHGEADPRVPWGGHPGLPGGPRADRRRPSSCVVDDAPTALLLCHNVTRAFAHSSIALSWHLLDPSRGEYTDGATVYTAAIHHPESVPGPADNPIYFLLFAAGELGAAVPSQWPRYFAIATAAAYAATSRLATDDMPATPFALAWSRVVEEVTGSLVDLSQPPRPDYRAWLWAGALSSVSMSGLPPGAEERSAAALADLRAAASLGLAQAGAKVNLAWRWDLPSVDVRGLAAAR